jgi:hypothetical protein
MATKFKVKRDVTKEECDWLRETVDEGSIVYECVYNTYGCISPSGIAVTKDEEGGYPFFELPYTALEKI